MLGSVKKLVSEGDGFTAKEQGVWGDYRGLKGTEVELSGFHEVVICFLLKGKLHVSIGKSKGVEVDKGQMFLILPHSPLYFKSLEETQTIVCTINTKTLIDLKYSFSQLPCNDNGETLDNIQCLPIKDLMYRFLSLVKSYIHFEEFKFGISNLVNIKEQELIYLLFTLYSSEELGRLFYPTAIGKNMQFFDFCKTQLKGSTKRLIAEHIGYVN